MRAQVRRLKELTREADTLERELRLLVRGLQPRLLELPGVGTLTAAKLIAEIAGFERFRNRPSSPAWPQSRRFPPPAATTAASDCTAAATASSNAAFHRIVVTQMRVHPPAQDYIARRLGEGKTKREAIRYLKRHLVRTIYNTLTPTQRETPAPALALTWEQPPMLTRRVRLSAGRPGRQR